VTRSEVLAVLREQAAALLDLDPDLIQESRSFKDDLDVDSLSLVEYTMGVEDALGVRLQDSDVVDLHTIGEFVDLLVATTQVAS
jgi:acyl carrier protein